MGTQALVQQAMAARELGLREDALQNGLAAYRLATECGASKIGLSALEELLRTQATWWLFREGFETARIAQDVARLEEPFPQASFRLARGMLWYASECFDDAKVDLTAALELAAESIVQPGGEPNASVYPQPLLQFGCHYMIGKVAAAQEEWDVAIDASNKAAALTNVASLPDTTTRADEAATTLFRYLSAHVFAARLVTASFALRSPFDLQCTTSDRAKSMPIRARRPSSSDARALHPAQ